MKSLIFIWTVALVLFGVIVIMFLGATAPAVGR